MNKKKILIFQQRGWALKIGFKLSKIFYNKNISVGAIIIKKSTLKKFEKYKKYHSFFIDSDSIKEDPKKYLDDSNFTLDDICADLNIDSVWPLIQGSRYHVKNYYEKYYFSYRQNLPDEQLRDYLLAIYKYLKITFEEFKPDLILMPNFAGLQHVMFSLYANKKKIPVLGVTDSKLIPNFAVFINDYMANSGRFIDKINNYKPEDFSKDEKSNLQKKIKEIKKNILLDRVQFRFGNNFENLKLKDKVKKNILPILLIFKYFLRINSNKLKNQKVTLDYQTPRIILRDLYFSKYYKILSEKYTKNVDIQNEFYIYFPLQFQPEATVDIRSPFYNNQLETIRQISMRLSGELKLFVKEHPSMLDKRTPSYLKKISKIPNVTLLSNTLNPIEVIKNSFCVISLSGTSIFQASILNKHSIQLGDYGITSFFPNVHKISNYDEIPNKIKIIKKSKLVNSEDDIKFIYFLKSLNELGIKDDYNNVTESWIQKVEDEDKKLKNIINRFVSEIEYYI